MSEHVKVTEEVILPRCYYGDCDHEGDCPIVSIEVCDGCRGLTDDGEVRWLIPWNVAERDGHREPPDTSATERQS